MVVRSPKRKGVAGEPNERLVGGEALEELAGRGGNANQEQRARRHGRRRAKA
jgi:hypothetical protein